MAINRMTKSASIRRVCTFLLIAGLGLFVLNCGGDDGSEDTNSGDDGFSSGVDGDKRTGDLSEDEEQAICDEMIRYGDGAISEEVWCEFDATGGFVSWPEEDAEVQQLCQERFEDCMDGDEFEDLEQFCVEAPEGCTATVAELEVCLELQLTNREEYFESAPKCESATRDEIEEFNANFESSAYWDLPPECEAIEDECDGYFREDISMP